MLGFPVQKRHGLSGVSPAQGCGDQGTGASNLQQDAKSPETAQSAEGEAWGNPTYMYKYLMGGNEEKRARLSSVVPTDWTRGNGLYLKYKKLHLKTFSYTESGQSLERGCGVFICANIQNMMGHGPGQPDLFDAA